MLGIVRYDGRFECLDCGCESIYGLEFKSELDLSSILYQDRARQVSHM